MLDARDVISLTPLGSFLTAATRAVAVFDLDRTVAPNTGYLFWRHVWTNHFSEVFSGSFNIPRTFQWLTDPKAVRRRLESVRETASFQSLAKEFAETAVEKDIFVRSAEEIAWRRANLQNVIIVTGGFDVFAEPIYRRLKADRVHSNARFMPIAVHGAKKPEILKEHYFNERAGFIPQAVYTDSHSDRYMIEAFEWPEVYLVQPDRRLRKMKKEGWRVLDPNLSNPDFPESVRDYAATVIKGPVETLRAVNFYSRWDARIKSTANPTAVERRNALAVAGLYLKEAPDLRCFIVEALGMKFELRCSGLYARLIARNPLSPTPLMAGV